MILISLISTYDKETQLSLFIIKRSLLNQLILRSDIKDLTSNIPNPPYVKYLIASVHLILTGPLLHNFSSALTVSVVGLGNAINNCINFGKIKGFRTVIFPKSVTFLLVHVFVNEEHLAIISGPLILYICNGA